MEYFLLSLHFQEGITLSALQNNLHNQYYQGQCYLADMRLREIKLFPRSQLISVKAEI